MVLPAKHRTEPSQGARARVGAVSGARRGITGPGDVLWGGDAAADAGERYFSAVLRCSSGGARLWTHYDAMDNALVQLHGEKRVLLFPPRVAAGLYLDGSSSPIVGLGVDGEGGWPEAFPAYRAAREAALEVILQPGDVLYVPALWAHHVEALHGPSVAVNVFFRELDKASYPAKDLYGNADPVAAAQALEACAGAAKRLASLPRDHRVFYGGEAAARLLRDLRVEREVAPTIAAGGIPGEDSAGGPGARTGAGAGANGAVAVRAPGEGWSGTISWGNLAVGVALGGAVVEPRRRGGGVSGDAKNVLFSRDGDGVGRRRTADERRLRERGRWIPTA